MGRHKKNSGINDIVKNAKAKEKIRKPLIKMHEEDLVHLPKRHRVKKIKQTFIDDGNFTYSKILVLRLVDDNNNIIEECRRIYQDDVTRNKYYRKGQLVVFRDNLLTYINDIITTEKDLVYIVKKADDKTIKKYQSTFGDIVVCNAMNCELKYSKPKKGNV